MSEKNVELVRSVYEQGYAQRTVEVPGIEDRVAADWRDQTFDILDDAQVELDEIVDVHGDGTTVLMLLRSTGTARHSGIDVVFDWGSIVTTRDGKLLRAQGYLGWDEARRAAGLSE